jgi:SMC interacting uncharacterized protein involved in chromosome segregation
MRIKAPRRTLTKRVDDLNLTVAELADHCKKLESWLAQAMHNMATCNQINTGPQLSDRIEHNYKETKRILTGLAERMDAIEPRGMRLMRYFRNVWRNKK